jgi:excinuclease UvrABC ATPase subunit
VKRGDGVVVVEHSLDLVAHADWVVDLGPGGGEHGGERLFCGPLARFLDEAESPTAEALRRHLAWRRRAGASSTIAPVSSTRETTERRAHRA